jgi:GT2 family glycosyltransferase
MLRAMPQDQVTVAITNWNGKHYLEACIDAVLAQTVTPREVILVDNASDDGSVEWVRSRYPAVRVLSLPRNDGPCPARNAGLEASTTEAVLSIDNDAILAPDCLERLLPHLRDDVAIVQPRAVFDADRARVHYDGADMHYVGMMTLHHFYAPVAEAGSKPCDVDACIAVALLLDKQKVLEVGAYDPAHFILFEDHDLSYRVRSRGYRIVREPAALVYHKEGTAGISFRKVRTYAPRRVFLHSRNRWLVILKCHGLRAIILSLPAFFVYDMAYLFFALKNRSLGAYFAGKWDLLRRLPAVWRERARVQKRRRVSDRVLLTADPLTISPLIERQGAVARLQEAMETFLRIWWKLVRPLV